VAVVKHPYWLIWNPGNHGGWELWVGPLGIRWTDDEKALDWNWGWWNV
jgi:hypothetical protein